METEPEPVPRRYGDKSLRVGLQPQVWMRTRGPRAVGAHQSPEPHEGLLAGHLLLDDRGHQRLHHQAGAPDPPVRVALARLAPPRGSWPDPHPVTLGPPPPGNLHTYKA